MEVTKSASAKVSGKVTGKGRATKLTLKIAERLDQIRRTQHKTQTVVADYLGVTFQQYQKYEKGKDRLPLERAIRLADFYKISLDRLIGREADSTYTEATPVTEWAYEADAPPFAGTYSALSNIEEESLFLFRQLSPEAQQMLLENMRLLQKKSGKN